MAPVPDCYRLVSGSAEGRTPLNAFDKALLEAGVGDTNLIRVSSIMPPGAFEKKVLNLPKGGLIPIAYAAIDSTSKHEIISAAVAVGIPENEEEAGVIMEWEDTAPQEEVKNVVRQMVTDAFDYRNRSLKEIKLISAEHHVVECGAAFAGVVLWYGNEESENNTI